MREHLTPGDIRRFLEGTLPRGRANRIFAHATSCPSCRAALHSRAKPYADADYERAIDRAFASALKREREVPKERARAEKVVARLLSGERRRMDLTDAERARLAGIPGIQVLLAQSRQQSHRDSRRMLELAELAYRVAERLDPGRHGAALVADFQALTAAELANAHRVADDLGRAEALLHQAATVSERGTGDLRLAARIADLTASLLGSRRQFRPAVQLLARVETIYTQLGERALAGRALIGQGIYTGLNHDPERALTLLVEGVSHIDREAEPELALAAFHNMVGFLADCGKYRQARILLWQCRPYYLQNGERLNLLRLAWLEGRIALGLADLARAERCLTEARDGFTTAEQIYDAALVTLDLMAVWLAQERFAEIEALARETTLVFQQVGVAQEATALMSWLWKSTRQHQLTAEFLEGIAFYLKELGPRLVRPHGGTAAPAHPARRDRA